MSESQFHFDFDQPKSEDGLIQWRRQRERASTRLARKLGLPIGFDVEVWLKNGVMLRGKLDLAESVLLLDTIDEQKLKLVIGRADFSYADLESCVRMD